MSKRPPRKRRRRTPVIRRPHAPGAGPGTVGFDEQAPAPKVSVLAYGPEDCKQLELNRLEDVDALIGTYSVVWVNVVGLGDEQALRDLAEHFGIHRLALEDVVHVHQRAKVEPYDKQAYIVARMVPDPKHPETRQVSFFVGEGYVLTFEEQAGDCFDPVRKRIESGHGLLRQSGADFLMYALLDSVVDSYFPLLEQVGDRIENLQDDVLESYDNGLIGRIHELKHELLVIRRAVWPHRDAIATLVQEDLGFVQQETHVYLRDSYDHIAQLLDMIETYRELASGLLDTFLTQVSNRMNEVMKVLTIFAAMFIPLSFVAGLYGMNFDTMPELHWRWSYPLVLLFMFTMAGTMLLFFKHKGWISSLKIAPRRNKERNDDDRATRG